MARLVCSVAGVIGAVASVETSLEPRHFIYPMFIEAGIEARAGGRVPIPSMPGVFRWSVDRLGEVLARMEYTVVSGGTEKACLLASKNTSQKFPRSLGYCGVGHAVAVGSAVKKISVGDRVLVYHGNHASYNIRKEDEITKVEDASIDSLDAAFVIIASMGLGGVRKLEIELGESAIVMGQGLLGIFSTQF